MNVLPVIARELRSQARQPFTYSLRALGVLALLGGGFAFAIGNPFAPNLGGALFGYLHLTLFCAIWILVPLSTADCISRERREGTLGLLFLTPLKPTDIVIAKSIAHGLRAATLLVAVLPVLTIPFLLGGVSWQQAAVSALVNFSSICWALAAALLSSSGSRSGLRAMVGAMVFAICGLLTFVFLLGLLVKPTLGYSSPWIRTNPDYTWLLGFGLAGVSPRAWLTHLTMFTPAQVLEGVVNTTVISALALATAVVFAAAQIRRTWREEPPPAWVRWWEKTFLTPVLWLNLFRRWMRWKLDRNPIGWLEQRTWQGRLVTWSWFAIIISMYSAVFTDRNFFRNFTGFQQFMAWLMMGTIASSAAGSFRRERETGVLELLLVAPLTTGQIIGGRLRGLWGQFLPALGILLGIWLYFDRIFETHDAVGPVILFSITFLTLPVIGLYFSVRCRNFLSAFVLTLAVGLGMPFALHRVIAFIAFVYGDPMVASYNASTSKLAFIPGFTQGALALLMAGRLRHRLETRSFPLERTQP